MVSNILKELRKQDLASVFTTCMHILSYEAVCIHVCGERVLIFLS